MKNIISKPSKKQLLYSFLVWFISVILSVLSITDLFREPFFSIENTAQYPLILGATIVIILLYVNYKKRNNNSVLRFVTSSVVGIVVSTLLLLGSLLVFYNSIDTIGTESQWKFMASLTSYIIFLLMFLVLIGSIVVVLLKGFLKKQ